MTWERFQYLCRASLANNSGGSAADQIERINAKPSAELYGELPVYSLAWKLLDAVKSLKSEEQAQLALKTYAEIDLTDLTEKPQNTKRLPAYLISLVLVFIAVVSIYKVRIFPSIVEIFDTLALPLTPETMFFLQHGPTIGYVLGLLMLLLVIASLGLTQLASLKRDYSQTPYVKHLCPSFIKEPYLKLIGLLHYPTIENEKLPRGIDTTAQAHLDDVVQSGLSLDKEIYALIQIEARRLARRCEIFAKTISVVTAIIVFFSIYQFVYGVYAPIFSLGATV